MDRRESLTAQALEYVLEHGLVGLSLRPLAAALGTSDRMLIYHFGSKERLVSAVLSLAQTQLGAALGPPGPDVRTLGDMVRHVWSGVIGPVGRQVTRLYVETCVLAAQEPDRFGTAPEALRGQWREGVRTGLVAFGVPPDRAGAVTDLILGTFDGLALDRLVATDPARVDAAAEEFADLIDLTPLRLG
ncbi:TetR/AcrR family transcriptional regulator [Tenggerimyces flavus]|uniref:TetR/AcrR family transcriptional regulator n=1 Tax=Tenggerimyces flavus TaxID=1708749 RepID=A0ABV7YH31_9ACTN|nr:TetR/AcrR family transcriptional regulator [Tenggerimyces flavus]MBM7783883.1 AcrR family transcriptional regulator [Tenggerimyces flavus]